MTYAVTKSLTNPSNVHIIEENEKNKVQLSMILYSTIKTFSSFRTELDIHYLIVSYLT